MSKSVHESGTRKRAIARATLAPGTGIVKVNNIALDHYGTPMLRSRIREPIKLAGDVGKFDISIRVQGGGQVGQADAIRLAIARALVQQKPALKQVFLDYDRQLLVADVRRKEVRKPNTHGKARSKRQKSYR